MIKTLIEDSVARSWLRMSIPALALLFAVVNFLLLEWNSDVAVAEMIWRDIRDGVPLSGWHFSDALTFFPDWPLWFGIRSVFGSVNTSLFLYSFLIHFFLFYWVSLQIDHKPSKLWFFGLLWLAIFPREWMVFSQPVHHGGALVVGLFFSHLYFTQRSINWAMFSLLAVLGALATASDLFFGLWFLVPCGIVTFTGFCFGKVSLREILKRGLLGCAILILSILLNMWVKSVLSVSTYGAVKTFDLGKTTFWPMFSYFFKFEVVMIAVVFGFIFFLKGKGDQEKTFFVASMAVTLFFVGLLGLWFGSFNVRYLFPISFFATLAIVNSVTQIDSKRSKKAIVIVVLVAAIAKVYSAFPGYIGAFEQQKDVDCVERTLENNHLMNSSGVASYWAFKLTKLFASKEFKIRQVNEGLRDYYWLTNSAWQSSSGPYKYFLVLANEAHDFSKNWTKDSKIITCGRTLVVFGNW